MVKKIIAVFIDLLFPKTHLQVFLSYCSQLRFEMMLKTQPQSNARMFHPFSYKSQFIKDCIFELKERNSEDVARLFSKMLGFWIIKKIRELNIDTMKNNVFIVPVPQHISKTNYKGFCHTTTLSKSIINFCSKEYSTIRMKLFPCVVKNFKTSRLHDSKQKRSRLSLIKNTMKAYMTKEDALNSYFFIIDDVYTTGATFQEVRRSLLGSGALSENIFFVSIAH